MSDLSSAPDVPKEMSAAEVSTLHKESPDPCSSTPTAQHSQLVHELARLSVSKVSGKNKKVLKFCAPRRICKTCKVVVAGSPKNFHQKSIQCDKCRNSFHFPCVNVFHEDDIPCDEKWYCFGCESEQ